MNYQSRLQAVRSLMAERGFDLLLVSQPDNRRYLTGFPAREAMVGESAGWLVIGLTIGYFVTSFLYYDAVAASVHDLEPVKAQRRLTETLGELLKKLAGGIIGFESSWVTYDVYQELAKSLESNRVLKSSAGLIEHLREVKDTDEMQIIQRAIDLTDRVYTAIVGQLRPGQNEKEVAWALERALREGGAEGMAFGPSVAFGVNSAVPHHEPTSNPLNMGDPVWIDMGARLEGYCADLTRSFAFGEASAEYQHLYDVVLRAQQAAIAGMHAGLEGKQADALAREIIAAAGYGGDFGHALGHGVGLAIHEAPRVGQTSEVRLRAGEVVTVEPGIYRAGWGGIRIEDVVVVRRSGVDVLSSAPKQFVVKPS